MGCEICNVGSEMPVCEKATPGGEAKLKLQIDIS
jgi:hypothetical protein